MTVETKTEVGTPAPTAKVDPRQRPDAVVVTQDNFNEYVDKKLAPESEPEPDVNDVDAVAVAEFKKIEAEKAAKKAKEAAETEEIDHPDKSKKDKLNERFSDLTKARKDAEAKAEARAKDAKDAADRADAAEREANRLRAQYEPPKSDELGPEPQPAQFTDTTEFAKALKEWTADSVRREDAKKQADIAAKADNERASKAWDERLKATKERLPDYQEKIDAAVGVKISQQATEAIWRSDVGPEILYHLAEHPEVAENLGKMNLGDMWYTLGRIAAEVGGTLKKADSTVTAGAQAGKAAISKAPAPISPINGGGSAAVLRLRGTDDVPKGMTYDIWKKLYESGKIQ